ncbi:hypothetical protein [Bacillus sp. TH50]|nr:hypothetical protein [Bacillus sp. TH50]
MIADDTDSVFTDENKTAISLYKSVSISIQAIQELEVKHNKEIAEIKQQHADDNKQLYSEIDALKKLVQKLINDKPEQP